MGDKFKMPSSEVMPAAIMVRDWLRVGHPHHGQNRQCEIAGSLRRLQGKSGQVGDVEIVVEPKFDTDLFGEAVSESAALDAAIQRCLNAGLLAWDIETPRNGPRYKRFVIPELGIPLDLFITTESNWGNILAIRTGDADFSRLLVTHRFKGGLLPNWMRHEGGRLYARAKGYPDFQEDPTPNDLIENTLPCLTETAFFRHLWLSVPLMTQRCLAGVRELSRQATQNQKAGVN